MATPVLPTLNRAKTVPGNADLIVVPITGEDEGTAVTVVLPSGVGKGFERKFGLPLTEMATDLGASARVGSTCVVPLGGGPRLLVVGLGKDTPTPETLRTAAGAAARAAKSVDGADHVAVCLPAGDPELLRAVVEGTILGQYAYAKVSTKSDNAKSDDAKKSDAKKSDAKKSDASKPAKRRKHLDTPQEYTVVAPVADESVVEDAATIAHAQLRAREWVNIPPNLLYPESFAAEVAELAKSKEVAVEVLDDEALAAGGYGGLTAVGGGSSRGPRLVRLAYSPRRARTHLVLVGKGVTFDSGGLNLKPGDSMSTMKCDMAGAAAVFAAVTAIAELGLPVKVTAYGCLAENLPSDTAFRPSDVLTMYGGKTVENYNTDAEGRLVMADGLARANEDEPDLVVDVATLTGAAMVALGPEIFGVFSDSDEVADRVLGAAESAGEKAWRLPMGTWSTEALESKVADLKSGGGRLGGASVAASFLRSFVKEGTDWAHLDIAPPAFNDGSPKGETPAGGTGVGVRTLVHLARSLV